MNGISATTGKPLEGLEHLRQSIRDILTTRIGTRVMVREYGSRLPDLIDNPVNARLTMDLYAATVAALARWEPRFRLSRVHIAKSAPGKVILDLEGEYLPENKTVLLRGIEVT